MSSCPPLRRQGACGTLVPGVATRARSVLVVLASGLMLVCLVIAPRPAASAAAASSPAAASTADAAAHPAPIALLVVSGWDWQRVLAGSSATADAGSGQPAASTEERSVAGQLAALASAASPANLVTRTAVATPTAADGLATLTAGARAAGPSVSTSRGYDADPHLLADSLTAAGLTFRTLNASGTAPDTASNTSADALADLTLINATDDASSPGSAARGLALLASLRQEAAREGTEVRVAVVSVAEGSNDPQILILPAGTTGWGGGEPVASPSTHQAGWVQLTDLAPTLLAALGTPVPAAMTGQALTLPDAAAPASSAADGEAASGSASPVPAPGEATPLTEGTASAGRRAGSAGTPGTGTALSGPSLVPDPHLTSLADAAARARASHAVTLPMCLLIVAVGLIPLLLAARLARRGVTARRVLRAWSASLWGAALPAGAWLTSLVPWWRLVDPAPTTVTGGAVLILVPGGITLGLALTLVMVSLWATRLVGRLRARRSARLGTSISGIPAVLIGVVTAALILVDAATGARLGFNGTLGMDAVVAGRFYGASNTAFALAAAALVVAVGLGAGPWVVSGRRWSRPVRAAVAVGPVGLVALSLDALPVTGADVGGGLTLVVALGVLAVALAGVRLRARHPLGLAVGAAAVMSGLGLVDWVTGPRTHLGRLAGQLVTGQVDDAAATLTRKLTSLVAPFMSNRLALVALVVGVAALAAAAWWLRRQVGAWRTETGGALGVLLPAPGAAAWQWLRPTLLALTTLIVVEVCVNDSGASMAWLSLAQASALLVTALPARVAPTPAERQLLATTPSRPDSATAPTASA